MEEKILCEAKFKTNIIAKTIVAIAGALILLSLTVGYTQWQSMIAEYSWYSTYPRKTGFFNGFMWDMFISPGFDRYIIWFFVFWIGVILLGYGIVIMLKMNRCSMKVSNTRVTGKASFGRQIDLPVNQISAVGLGSFDSITVATSAGKISFWLVENRNEVCGTLNELLGSFQKEAMPISAPTADSADQIAKYKDLLDKGVISQEEFDAKKKQLLGL